METNLIYYSKPLKLCNSRKQSRHSSHRDGAWTQRKAGRAHFCNFPVWATFLTRTKPWLVVFVYREERRRGEENDEWSPRIINNCGPWSQVHITGMWLDITHNKLSCDLDNGSAESLACGPYFPRPTVWGIHRELLQYHHLVTTGLFPCTNSF